jgi:carboxyvinyl-carboxyphosphonate phosphorylmutase
MPVAAEPPAPQDGAVTDMTQLLSRQRFRNVLSARAAVSPASVYDPLSARVAESVGYELGILAGSIASMSTLAAPDILIMTLTEVADQVRRIARTSQLALLVDADHGYGNAFNVHRTIAELEHAGAAAVSIEDTLLPPPFGVEEGTEQVIPTAEMVGKLKAAIAARTDPAFVIAGRTSSLRVEGLAGAVERVRAYAATGVDVIFVVGIESATQVQALHDAAGLPVIAGPSPKAKNLQRAELAAAGAALFMQGHQPFAAVAEALRRTYEYLRAENDPAAVPGLASKAALDELVRVPDFAEMARQYLR